MMNTPVLNKNDNEISINTNHIITNIDDRKMHKLVWGVVSALYIINTDAGPVIPLVQRTKDTSNPLKWALLPSGGIDSKKELLCPNIAMEREIVEEVLLFENNEYVYPLSFHHDDSESIIHDVFDNKKYHAYGEFFIMENTLFLISTFTSKKMFRIDDLLIVDGETKEGENLHRDVILVPIDSDFNGIVQPISHYKEYNHLEPVSIDLRDFQTPTLEYLRTRGKIEK